MQPLWNEGLAALAGGLVLSPFTRTRRLLADIEPGMSVIDMTIGEPRETDAGLHRRQDRGGEGDVRQVSADPRLATSCAGRSRPGSAAAIDLGDAIDPMREVHPTNGSREGLFYAALPAVGRRKFTERPAVLLPNPYYAAYIGAAAHRQRRAGLSRRRRRDRPPARPRCARGRRGAAAPAPPRSICARPPTRRARWPTAPT